MISADAYLTMLSVIGGIIVVILPFAALNTNQGVDDE